MISHPTKLNYKPLSKKGMTALLLCCLVLLLASCKRYYVVPTDGLEVHKTIVDTSEVLFTLNKGEIVYTNIELKSWGSVYRKDNKEQNGWIRTHLLVRLDEATEDSLSAEATAERKARRQAERDREKQKEDSIRASLPRAVYFTVVADSIDLYTHDMSTKEGRKNGHKFCALEKGRRIYTMKDGHSWMMIYTADDGKREHGYIQNRGLQRLGQAETDSLNNLRIDSTRGYAFKSYFPTMVIGLVILALAGIVPYAMMLWQRKRRHFGGISLTYLCAILFVMLAAARLDGSMNFKWCYNILPFSLSTLLVFPLYYTDISRKNMRRIFKTVLVLMLPLCFVLFAHHQDSYLWEPLKMWALNALLFYGIVWIRINQKCPYCGMYGEHFDAGETYGGRQKHASTSTVEHKGTVVGRKKKYMGGNVTKIIEYVTPDYIEETVTTYLVDIFHKHSRCICCDQTFKDGSREVRVDGSESSKTEIKEKR